MKGVSSVHAGIGSRQPLNEYKQGKNKKDLVRVVKTAQRIVGAVLPDLDAVCAGPPTEAWTHNTPRTLSVCPVTIWEKIQNHQNPD